MIGFASSIASHVAHVGPCRVQAVDWPGGCVAKVIPTTATQRIKLVPPWQDGQDTAGGTRTIGSTVCLWCPDFCNRLPYRMMCHFF